MPRIAAEVVDDPSAVPKAALLFKFTWYPAGGIPARWGQHNHVSHGEGFHTITNYQGSLALKPKLSHRLDENRT